jgi:hypothetical protein
VPGNTWITDPSDIVPKNFQSVRASVSVWRTPRLKAPMSGKPGISECVTNPGDSLDALGGRNGNEPGADPDFPSQIYANGNRGTRQVNPEGDTVGAGIAVIFDYAISAASCIIGVLF